MPDWGDIFGADSAVGQILLYGVGQQLIQAILGPVLTDITQDLWAAAVQGSGGEIARAPSPADLADWVVRGVLDQATAQSKALLSGVSPDDFQSMVLDTGEPPGLETVLEAFRRGFVQWDDAGVTTPSVERAIKTSRVYDYWSPVLQQLVTVPLTPSAAVEAAVRGQLSFDDAQAAAAQSGVSAADFQTMFNVTGNPPSPTELTELVRRAIIPMRGTGPDVTSFQQGIYEGDAKDKWEPAYEALTVFIPPAREVTTLERAGAITAEQAQSYYAMLGLPPDLAAAYSASASGEKMAGSKQLAEQAVLTLYESQVIDGPTAVAHLELLGYSATDSAFLLQVTDLNREVRAVTSAVTRIGTLYVTRKITRQAAETGLGTLAVNPTAAANMLATWDTERAATVKQLTAAEIADGLYYKILTQPQAQAELEALGYTPLDAWTLLSVRIHGPLPDQPPAGPGGPGVNP